MVRYTIPVLLFCGLVAGADLNITLTARVAGRQQSIASGQAAPPALTMNRGEMLAANWTAINPATPKGSSATIRDVTLHVFMDRDAAKISQTAPKPGPDAAYEGAVTLDFQPGEQSKGEFRMRLQEPGTYLVRVETIGARARMGHEVFAAMQVTVK
jgi:hypothetical protein